MKRPRSRQRYSPEHFGNAVKSRKSTAGSICADVLIGGALAAGALAVRLHGNDCSGSFLNSYDGFYFARISRTLLSSWPDSVRELFRGRLSDPLCARYQNGIPQTRARGTLMSVSTAWLSKMTGLPPTKLEMLLGAGLCSLTAVPVYFYGKKCTDRVGGITAALSVSLAPSFVVHSVPGFYDTDALLCPLPLLMMGSLAEMLKADDPMTQLSSAAVGLLSFASIVYTWTGFYSYALLGTGSLLLTSLVLGVARPDGFRPRSLIIPTACAAGIVHLSFALYANVFHRIRMSVEEVFPRSDASNHFSSASAAYHWPDSSRFVNECKKPKLFSDSVFGINTDGIINLSGGLPMFLPTFVFAAEGLISLFKGAAQTGALKKNDIVDTVFFDSWLLSTLPVAFRRVRFTQLFALPQGMILGLGAGRLSQRIRQKKNVALGAAALSVGAFSLFRLIQGDAALSKGQQPLVTEEIDEGCRRIRNGTAEDAVLISWWDLGYYYQYQARRRTVGDGGMHGDKPLYWLGHLLMTDDPELSRGICVMLQNCGTEATDIAVELTGNCKAGAEMLTAVLPHGREDARRILTEQYALSALQADRLLELTHPAYVPELYLIITGDMLVKAAAIGYYGFWDFSGRDYVPGLKISDAENGGEPKIYASDDLKKSLLFKLATGTEFSGGFFVPVFANSQMRIFRIDPPA